jgi:hypothetical protein
MYCRPYSAGVLHSVSDQIQNLQNCLTTPIINDYSKDDIKGLVSLKFLRPWVSCSEGCDPDLTFSKIFRSGSGL